MENWKEWRDNEAEELKNIPDHSERRGALSLLKEKRDESYHKRGLYWQAREAKIVHNFVEAIKKDLSENPDSREAIKRYQELCCFPFGFYNFFHRGARYFFIKNSRIKDAFDSTVRDISELEFFLSERIEVPPISEQQTDLLVQRAIQYINKPCFIHATDAEMLPWFINSDIANEATDSFLESNFGYLLNGSDYTGKWFFSGIKRYEQYYKQLQTDTKLRENVQIALKDISSCVTGSGNYMQFIHTFEIPNNNDPLKGHYLYLDHKEYLSLKESGFFEKPLGDIFSDTELEIVSNSLARFYDSLKGGGGTSSADMVLWLSKKSKNEREYLELNNGGTLSQVSLGSSGIERTPGINFISIIQCANGYSLRRVLKILNLNLYDSYEDYPVIIDRDGNLLWPKTMTREEMVKMKEKSEQK